MEVRQLPKVGTDSDTIIDASIMPLKITAACDPGWGESDSTLTAYQDFWLFRSLCRPFGLVGLEFLALSADRSMIPLVVADIGSQLPRPCRIRRVEQKVRSALQEVPFR